MKKPGSGFSRLNYHFAKWCVDNVSTMACAYLFALIALIALPDAIHETFSSGIHPLPLVAWLSQSFLQLTLLSIIMVGQDVQAASAEERANKQFDAVMETVADMREVLQDIREVVSDDGKIIELLNKMSGNEPGK